MYNIFDHSMAIIHLKVVSAIFHQMFISQQMIVLRKLWKMFFISSKKLFCSRDIQIFVFLSSLLFPPVRQCSKGWSKINLQVYDVMSSVNLIPHFVWYFQKQKSYGNETLFIDRVLNKEHMEKLYRKCAQKPSPKPLLKFGK